MLFGRLNSSACNFLAYAISGKDIVPQVDNWVLFSYGSCLRSTSVSLFEALRVLFVCFFLSFFLF